MHARVEGEPLLTDPLIVAPAARVRQNDRTRCVDAVDLDADGSVRELRTGRRSKLNVVRAAGRHVDRIGEPFAGFEILDDIGATRLIAGTEEIDALARAELRVALIAGGCVVVTDAFTAQVEVFSLEGAWNGRRRAEIGRRSYRLRHRCRHSDGTQREIRSLGNDLQHARAGR